MNEEQFENKEQTREEPQNDQQSRKTMEKIWDATVDTWHHATFRAGKYSRVVQKKIDLTSLHKKIGTAHADLGKMIDDLHQTGEQEIMNHNDVREILDRLTGLRSTAAAMEEEIATIRNQELAEEMHGPEESDAKH